MRQIENDQVLGQSQHKNGIKATMFAFEDKGIFYLAGEGAKPRIARAFYIDGPAADKIALRARALRQDAGTLAGYCTGSDETGDTRRFLDDVLTVFGGDTKLWCVTVADRLRDQFPGVYGDITPVAVASQLRDLKVTVKNVREPGRNPNQGCERADVEAAAGAVLAGV
jgi:S-DNA-T family DNA segregation ATPase FtsK/SpoIIIE